MALAPVSSQRSPCLAAALGARTSARASAAARTAEKAGNRFRARLTPLWPRPAAGVAGLTAADVVDASPRSEELRDQLLRLGSSARRAVRILAGSIGHVLERRRRHADRAARVGRVRADRADVPVEHR